jgi:hypothetical protein
LGSNEKEIVMYTNALRHMEFDKLKVTRKISCKSDTNNLYEDELVGDRATQNKFFSSA